MVTKAGIVFVHGIWADGSSFSKVIPALQADGHEVIAAQYGLDTPRGDVDAVIRDELDAADAIILGCPTYMGSMSAGMKSFIEVAARKWFSLAWRNKIAGAFTNSSSFSGDKLNTLVGFVINAVQHGMISVGLGMLPAANRHEEMTQIAGPGPNAHNRVGSFIGPMAARFPVNPSDGKRDLETAEIYGQRVVEITLQFIRGSSA